MLPEESVTYPPGTPSLDAARFGVTRHALTEQGGYSEPKLSFCADSNPNQPFPNSRHGSRCGIST
jgi:hypothetical protein